MIIVVDDDARWGAFVARELRRACEDGFEVRIVESGEQALSLIEENPERAIDAIITNFHLGTGMNGARLAERVMACAPDPKPVIIVRTTRITPEVVSDYFRAIRRKEDRVRDFARSVMSLLPRASS